MITLLSWLWGCAGPAWSEEGALSPTLAHMDTDADGVVREAEYDAVRYRGPLFSEVDRDGDGELSGAELLATVLARDPASLSPARPSPVAETNKRRTARKSGGGAAGKGGGPGGERVAQGPANVSDADQRQIREETEQITRSVLLALKEEILAVDPSCPTPSDEAIKRAGSLGDLRTVESRAVLAELEAGCAAVGLSFPAPLTAAALAHEPVTPSVPAVAPATVKPRVRLGPDGQPLRPGKDG